MARSSVYIAMLCVVALLSSRTSNAFTISLAPLLTARLGLGPFGNNYVKHFPAPSSPSSPTLESTQTKAKIDVPRVKPSVENFKFEYDDIRMLSGCKSECLELIYAKSLERGFEYSS